jgi:LysM repeat protein
MDVEIGETHDDAEANAYSQKEVLRGDDRCWYDKASTAVCLIVVFMARLFRLVPFLVGVLLFMPSRVLAGGPLPPPAGVFRAPPTPTPPPPLPTPVSLPTEAGLSAKASDYRLYLPRLRTTSASYNRAETVATEPASAEAQPLAHVGPPAGRFLYTIRPGDTPERLAIALGRDVNIMACVRQQDGRPVSEWRSGVVVLIPALGDLCHRVKSGETVARIAAWYGIAPETLLSANQLPDESALRPGQYLLIPDARSRYRDPEEARIPRTPGNGWRYGDGRFIWPIANGATAITQGFRHGQHMALDIAAEPGTPVYAADTGTVLKAGWSDNGYGYHIVIDHGIDYITLYAHLREYFVKSGDIVNKGDIIGLVGSTGNSTGPHLHFEVRDYGYLIDPLLVLPKNDNP